MIGVDAAAGATLALGVKAVVIGLRLAIHRPLTRDLSRRRQSKQRANREISVAQGSWVSALGFAPGFLVQVQENESEGDGTRTGDGIRFARLTTGRNHSMSEPSNHREPRGPREPELPVIKDPPEPGEPKIPEMPPPVPDPPDVVDER
jgi:hypothetical protein